MGKRINLREYWSKKAAQGRMGDSEMRVVKGEAAHVNPVEADIIDRHGKAGEEIVTQIGSGTINPKTGYREYAFPWLAAAYVGSKIVKGIGATSRRKKQVEALKKQRKAQMKALDQASQMTGEEQQAMQQMQKGAEEGTMDVEGLSQQMAQPLYQQGEAQEAMQQAQITQQGLEGSIIAQDVSRKIGSDVRANIAEQARQIAFDNEKTKADAARRLQDAKMRRGQLLRDIAIKRGQVEADYAAGRASMPSDWDILGDLTSDIVSPKMAQEDLSSWYQGTQEEVTSTSSDIRLKENITYIGKSNSGINVYEFDYKDKSYGKGRYRGVMAQEVPEVSIKSPEGYLMVDYSKIDVTFERID